MTSLCTPAVSKLTISTSKKIDTNGWPSASEHGGGRVDVWVVVIVVVVVDVVVDVKVTGSPTQVKYRASTVNGVSSLLVKSGKLNTLTKGLYTLLKVKFWLGMVNTPTGSLPDVTRCEN
jgi:hypothetical protein